MSTVNHHAPRLLRPAIGALLTAALLSGCGVAGTDFQPGAAATIGDTTISGDEVDGLTRSACAAFDEQLAEGNTAVPLSYLRSTIVQDLALAEAARQLGEEYDVEPGASYQRELASVRANTGELPDDQARAVEVLQTSQSLVSDVLGQVGAAIAAESADDDGGADAADLPGPASEEAVQLGGTAFQEWLGDNDVSLDPKYGVELGTEGVAPADTSVSFAVSDVAVAGSASEPDPEATMELPASQRCGSYTGEAG